MPTPTTDPIRIRVVPRDGERMTDSPRDAFWAPLRETEGFSNLRITQLEAKLCREFGGALRSALFNQLSRGIRTLDSELFPASLRDFEHFFFEFMGPRSARELYGYQFADAFTRYLEHRQQVLSENVSLREAQERLAAASSIFFSTRIAGYSSLDLDLSAGSFQQLAKVFDGNFDTLRVFLDAFVPVAFAEVFTEQFADGHEFGISIPRSAEQAFGEASRALEKAGGMPPRVAPPPTAPSSPTSAARERAEWIWRLANGSLLIPLLIALAVMFYGLRLLSDIRSSQFEAMQPILQHQLELLREDRLRMSAEPPPGISTQTQDSVPRN